jgi:hypothetical protein
MPDTVRYRWIEDGFPRRRRRVRVVIYRGWEGFEERGVAPCSSCHEYGEYGGCSCDSSPCVGGGCDECGYTGKRRWRHWLAFDMDAYLAWEHRRYERRERLLAFWRRDRMAA